MWLVVVGRFWPALRFVVTRDACRGGDVVGEAQWIANGAGGRWGGLEEL